MPVLGSSNGCTRAAIAAGIAALLVGAAPHPAAADTFLLKDGARVQGDLLEEIRGPDRKPWLVVRTPFGTTRFPKKGLKKRLHVDLEAKPLVCSSIMVSTLKGVVERSGDGGEHWTRISPRSREGRTLDDLPINSPNSVVAPGQHVRTGADGEIDLDLGWGVVHVAASSHVSFATDGDSTMQVKEGRMGARLDALPEGGEFRVETPQTSMGVRGTTFAIGVDATVARLAVADGVVRVADRDVAAGRAVTVATDGTLTEGEPAAAERRIFDRLRDTFSIPRIDRIRVPGGRLEFRHGNTTTRVRIPAFELARTEVTMAQLRRFQAFMEKHRDHYFCHPAERPNITHAPFTMQRRESEHPDLEAWEHEHLTGDDQPAGGVSWFTAYAFCAWIGARLPSETTWTWAAQGATNKPDHDASTLAEQSWLFENSGDLGAPPKGKPYPDDPSRIRRSHPVATRTPNRLGLHDMYGNAWEWVFDRSGAPEGQIPTDGSPWVPPLGSEAPPDPGLEGGVRVARGGTYEHSAAEVVRAKMTTFAMGPGASMGFRPQFRDR